MNKVEKEGLKRQALNFPTPKRVESAGGKKKRERAL